MAKKPPTPYAAARKVVRETAREFGAWCLSTGTGVRKDGSRSLRVVAFTWDRIPDPSPIGQPMVDRLMERLEDTGVRYEQLPETDFLPMGRTFLMGVSKELVRCRVFGEYRTGAPVLLRTFVGRNRNRDELYVEARERLFKFKFVWAIRVVLPPEKSVKRVAT